MVKKVFQALATLILVAVILVAIGIILAPRFGWQIAAVYSGSMEPAITVGSLVVVQPVAPQTIKEGDVITYAPPTDTSLRVTHRVIEVVEDEYGLMFRTKGDANEDLDAYGVPAQNVAGRVWLSVPYAGYVMDFIQKPIGLGLLLGVPAAIIIGMELGNIYKAIREWRQKGHIKQASNE